MRIVALSDTHRRSEPLLEAGRKFPADLYLHLGDGWEEYCAFQKEFPERSIDWVRGNCDYLHDGVEVKLIEFDGHKILYTHGHRFDVKYSYHLLEQYAREKGAEAALFGHTHIPFCEYREGLWLVNPGSAGLPSRTGSGGPFAAIVETAPTGLQCHLHPIYPKE